MPDDASSDDSPSDASFSRRTFLKSTGTVAIGFSLLPGCQGTEEEADAAEASDPVQSIDLPPSLAQHPRIDAWLQVLGDGRLRVYTGKLELGQGIRIAIAQVAAEELHTSPDRLDVRLAETGVTPNERYTSGSVSIEHSATSVRQASATARRILKERAARQFGVSPEEVTVDDGTLMAGNQSATFSEVLDGDQITETVTEPTDLRPTGEREWVGEPVKRTDIGRMVRGEEVYVHDLRFDDMVHARVVRPPGYGASLQGVDEEAVREAVGNGPQIVQNGSFVAVVAKEEHQALQAHQALRSSADWSEPATLPADAPLEEHIRDLPTETESVVDEGQGSSGGETVSASYFRPYVMHASLGPSCAVGHYDGDRLRIWTHSQGVYPLRDTLTELVGLPPEKIAVKGVPGSGCYGHNGADDVAADVALLAMAVPNRHVRLQWERTDEHGWEPYGSAMIQDVEVKLGDDGSIQDWQFDVHTDTHSTRPGGDPGTLLAGRYVEDNYAFTSRGYLAGGYRNAVPYYELPSRRVDAHFFDGPLRVSALRGLGAYANVFAIESMMGELADRAGADPVGFRRDHLEDSRAVAVLDAVAEQAGGMSVESNEGLGYGFARYKNSASYCAVAARVQAEGGDVRVTHLWGAIDAGEVINPDGLRNQLEGGMIQSTSWMLHEEVQFDDTGITSREWGSYPILRFEDVPVVEATVLDRPDQPPLGAGEAAQGPATGAVANAIARATGERVRSLPVRSS